MTALVIGYGNPLRTDDGLGWHAAAVLALAHLEDTRVLQRHQLTPELAVDVAGASVVVFVDARPPGGADDGVRVEEVEPHYGPLTWTHHLTPGELLALTALSGQAPPHAWLVSAPALCTEPGDGLSPAERALLPDVLARVSALVTRAEPLLL